MDTSNGRIYRIPDDTDLKAVSEKLEKFKKLKAKLGDKLVEMKVQPTTKQMNRKPPRVGKYESCPCGSGKKFKWCCFTGHRNEVDNG